MIIELGQSSLRTKTITIGTTGIGEGVVVIPLPMEIISHVDNIVHHGRHVLDRKSFQVPI